MAEVLRMYKVANSIVIGDVQEGDGKNDSTIENASTEIMGFLHVDTQSLTKYRKLQHQRGDLFVSDGHLVFILDTDKVDGDSHPQRCGVSTFNGAISNLWETIKAVPAINIKPGDFLVYSTTNGREQCLSEILTISHVQLQGAYAPLTTSGHFSVDGVLVSSYVDPFFPQSVQVVEHTTAHFFFAPVRWMWQARQTWPSVFDKFEQPLRLVFGKGSFFHPADGEMLWYARLLFLVTPMYTQAVSFF